MRWATARQGLQQNSYEKMMKPRLAEPGRWKHWALTQMPNFKKADAFPEYSCLRTGLYLQNINEGTLGVDPVREERFPSDGEPSSTVGLDFNELTFFFIYKT